MGKNNGHADLEATGGAKLTGKQERVSQLVALEGLDQSEAYRQVYDVGPDTQPATVWSEASRLVADPKVSARIAELRATCQEQSIASRERIVEELAKVAFADRQEGPVRDADKTAALDKLAKVTGLYRETPEDPHAHPIHITHVTVVLSHGETEEREIAPRPVVDGESHVLPGDEPDSEGKQ